MDAKKKRSHGQAIFEVILFLPFLIYLFKLIITFGNSINGSINQQKILRSTYYLYVNNSSYILRKEDLEELLSAGFKSAGFLALAWAKEERDTQIIASCYKIDKLFGNPSEEQCDERAPQSDRTDFIRIFTYYGVCGPYYEYDSRLFLAHFPQNS